MDIKSNQPTYEPAKTENTFGDDMEKNLFSVFEKPVKRERDDAQGINADVVAKTRKIEGGVTSTSEIKTTKYQLNKGCVHKITLPPNYPNPDDPDLLTPKYPTHPARTYKFELDPFQKTAISCIERNESVLVAAHTSAGKTVVAEYAIARALANGQKVIYTSPIKALSNQKYRDLAEVFHDVGLMTGDITINPHASCLVMTTEILRNMLYRGNEIMRQVAWVIFDEIHYMRNKERGVVWEETIIMLPDTVHYVFLSATIPNAEEFAAWIATIHSQCCHVVTTDMRPVPLQHYIFPAGGDKLYLVVDEKGEFHQDNFLTSLTQINTGTKRDKKGKKTFPDCYNIVKLIMEKNYDPVIVFAFSKKDCELLAQSMSKLDFNSDEEKELVKRIFDAAIGSLSPEDRELPQIKNIFPLLRRGIGVHHSGLLPVIKEVIEILFQEGLIKALFATETFSMGLNMPAKTVVFTNVRKFDGDGFRTVTSGEYIQMSGRAGRRGLDDRGIVILIVDDRLEPSVCKEMIFGESDPLNSAFYIGYNMMLNLFRVDGIDPEYLISRSFRQFQAHNSYPEMKRKVEQLEKEKSEIVIEDVETVSEYYYLKMTLEKYRAEYRARITNPLYCVPMLQPGRLISVKDGAKDFGWGVVVNFSKKTLNDTGRTVVYIVEALLNVDATETQNTMERTGPMPAVAGKPSKPKILPFVITLIEHISSLRVYVPHDVYSEESRNTLYKSVCEVEKRFPAGIPLLDPVEDMGIEDEDFKKLVKKIESLEDRLLGNKKLQTASVRQGAKLFQKRVDMENQIKELKRELRHANDIILKEDLRAMKRVLRRLGYIDENDLIQMKGRVAATISAGDEILLTELIFGGLFNSLSPEEAVAVLACFVTEEKSDDTKGENLPENLAVPFREVQSEARRVVGVMQECKVAVETEEYIQRFKPTLMEVVFAWANGSSFQSVLQMTETFEGNVVRILRRLEELLKELIEAAKAIGNTDLETKFSDGSSKIKRDIVFAASLYL